MDDMTPLGPTRHYVIVCHDGRRIDVDADSMLAHRVVPGVLGHPGCHRTRQVCVRRIAASEVRQVEREDGPIWSTT
jgi:hypothetical protein